MKKFGVSLRSMKFLLNVCALMLCLCTSTGALANAQEHAAKASGTVPIASAAQLRDYLGQGSPSPLDWLSPNAKRRFIDSLQFGSSGLSGFSLNDLEAELTCDEARQVLTLFGAGSYAPPAAQMRSKRLNIGATETATVSAHFDRLLRAKRAPAPAREVEAIYAHSFRPLQTPARLRVLSDGDLSLAMRAASNAAWFDSAPSHAADVRLDLAELHRRGLAAPSDYRSAYHALIRSRDFTLAADLRNRYVEAELPALPFVRNAVEGSGPSVLQVSADGTELVRRNVKFDAPIHIIVIAGCHFARDAARDIESDPRLRAAFARHSLWLTPPDGNPADPDLIRWNREHPLTAMSSAYRESEWPQIDTWAMPTFYFFKDGTLDAKVVGWQRASIEAELRKLNLMP